MASINAGVPYENRTKDLYMVSPPFELQFHSLSITLRPKTCSAYEVELHTYGCGSGAQGDAVEQLIAYKIRFIEAIFVRYPSAD